MEQVCQDAYTVESVRLVWTYTSSPSVITAMGKAKLSLPIVLALGVIQSMIVCSWRRSFLKWPLKSTQQQYGTVIGTAHFV